MKKKTKQPTLIGVYQRGKQASKNSQGLKLKQFETQNKVSFDFNAKYKTNIREFILQKIVEF